ncbi:MAG: hypothetical protein ACREOG_12270 [Gemmatimonadaceae bacterium]
MSASRLALNAESLDQQPLVIIDGVALHAGVQRLADIPVGDVHSVIVLRPADAVLRYGTRAHKGAILVTTKVGASAFDQPNWPNWR